MSTDRQNDEILFDLLKQGHIAAYKEIYDRYKSILYIHAYKMLQDEEEAKDVVQEVFIILWNKRTEINLKTFLAAYLYKAVKNRILDLIANKKVRLKYEGSLQSFLLQGECLTDYNVREKELRIIIEREISSLPAKMRTVFELSRKEHLPYKQIAQRLNISDKTVKKQVNNAIKILRLKLGSLFILLPFIEKLFKLFS
ncbi:RNA polymerase sigma factor [Mucilaginibacter arboris]|uniref:RNA polymerase sigma-70 factor n=1 Tax=Mucilaginibacter arboris TaxID=2682090 RepID=A0A7K1ST18_9SPHI|nr:RNA polymerase sigma-70 factor [Mucilaginibacter arboris]MVN20452.1 RNA polymerase sigma-70 factor [Mucilaginibacter arboris]